MKISVLTPSYNSGKYLERAVQSVLQQDYDNWEHIVVDGGSTDNTLDILKKYPHIKWISEPDKGQSDAMNKAFAMSSGDIIIYLNADDEIEKNIFGLIIKTFQEYPDCDMIIGSLRFICQDGSEFIKIPSESLMKILRYKWRGEAHFPANPVSYYYKRYIQEKIGGYSLENHYAMDYEFLLNAYAISKIHKVSQVLGTYYFDGNNKSSNLERVYRSLDETRDKFLHKNKDINNQFRQYDKAEDRKEFFNNLISKITQKLAIRTRLRRLFS